MKKLIALTFMFINFAFADCKPMNLVSEANSPFNKLPVLDQDGTSLCFAYAAAQLMDYDSIKSGTGRRYHPLWVAMKHSEMKNKGGISGGLATNAVEAVNIKQNCPYELVSQALMTWARKANTSEVSVMHLFETYGQNLMSNTPNALVEAIKLNKKWCGQSSAWETLSQEIEKIKDVSSIKMFQKLLSETCKPSALTPAPYSSQNIALAENEVETSLGKQLAESKAPVGIGLCANFFTAPSYRGVNRAPLSKHSTLVQGCGIHEVIVVGKRPKNNSCEFLVRNSWGSGFSDATKGYECVCRERATGKVVDNCRNSTHNNGRYTVEACWMGGEPFVKNTFKMITLKKI